MSKQKETSDRQSIVEVIDVAGEKLVEKVRKLAEEGNVRRLRVIEPDGDVAVDISLTVGAIAGGAVVLAAPALAVIGALAALVTRVRIEIVRDEAEATPAEADPENEPEGENFPV